MSRDQSKKKTTSPGRRERDDPESSTSGSGTSEDSVGGCHSGKPTLERCCGIQLRTAKCPICQEPVATARERLSAVDEEALDTKMAARLRLAESDVAKLRDNGRRETSPVVWQYQLAQISRRLDSIEDDVDDEAALEALRDAHQIITLVAAEGGEQR